MPIGIEFPDYTITEGEGPLEVCGVIIEGGVQREVVFTLSNVDGTATSPEDYEAFVEELTFDADNSRVCINVTIEDDTLLENPENFTVIINTNDPDATIPDSTSSVTILDNDGVVIGFEMEIYNVREDQGTLEVCALLISGELPAEREVVVNLNTGNLQAMGGLLKYTEIIMMLLEFILYIEFHSSW